MATLSKTIIKTIWNVAHYSDFTMVNRFYVCVVPTTDQ